MPRDKRSSSERIADDLFDVPPFQNVDLFEEATTSLAVAGVILAAGRSKRLGTPKEELRIGDETVLNRLIRVYLEAGLKPVRVVVGAIQPAISHPSLEICNADPDGNMIDSLVVGIEGLECGIVAQPVDAPFTTPALIASLIRIATTRVPGSTVPVVPVVSVVPVVPVFDSENVPHELRRGHPVFVPPSLYPKIRERPLGGLRHILADPTSGTELMPCQDEGILADIDLPADVLRWRERLEKS